MTESTKTKLAERRAGLERNQVLREGRETLANKFDWGFLALNIPEANFYALCRINPELTSQDNDVQMKAWKKFMSSPEAVPYLVVRPPAQVQRSNNHRIITK